VPPAARGEERHRAGQIPRDPRPDAAIPPGWPPHLPGPARAHRSHGRGQQAGANPTALPRRGAPRSTGRYPPHPPRPGPPGPSPPRPPGHRPASQPPPGTSGHAGGTAITHSPLHHPRPARRHKRPDPGSTRSSGGSGCSPTSGCAAAPTPHGRRPNKTSATGSGPGTTTPGPSPGPRPPTKSLNASPHIFNEFLARDTGTGFAWVDGRLAARGVGESRPNSAGARLLTSRLPGKPKAMFTPTRGPTSPCAERVLSGVPDAAP
jgi:hypothetical protein